jgi:hypothetical protein
VEDAWGRQYSARLGRWKGGAVGERERGIDRGDGEKGRQRERGREVSAGRWGGVGVDGGEAQRGRERDEVQREEIRIETEG